VKHDSSFVAITTEGGLLPADFLAELLSPKADIEGLSPTSYNLADGERTNEQVNRSWNRLKGRWTDFQKAIAGKTVGESTTTETRDRWLQPLFQELGYGQRLERLKPIEVDGKSYPVSHGWDHVPIHLVGTHLDLDHRTPGAVGAAKASPHSLVQQVLNASDNHLWGIVSNGLTFRLLRDNIALTRQAYVDWDLAAIFDGDLYAEFFLLWLVAHQSRFDAEQPEQCWLEKWTKKAEDKGLRALEKLRPGVARAIEALGAGLLSHPANKSLLQKLRSGELSTQDFYRQVLRIVYRIIFLLVAEERDLLHRPFPESDAPKGAIEYAVRARKRYAEFYSISRLRPLTPQRAGTPHPDLWQVLQLITQKLGSDTGCPELALPPLGSFLWLAERSTSDLIDTLVSNRSFLTAVYALAFVQDGSIRRAVDYKNLGAEELGSVYEGLLELHPQLNADTGSFELNFAAGNERKTSGSYYTPESLVQCLLDSALEPVIDEAVRGKEGQAAADTLLKQKICDPAVGSGHFLIAAAHRLAKRVAAARSGEDEPSPQATRTALRDVIGRCLYGVDVNPMSAELCRMNLWLEALEPGKPLSFLDHHIRVGNSLLGTTPELIAEGLPDEAFTAIEGDDKKACGVLKKRNKAHRGGLGPLFSKQDAEMQARLQQAAAALGELPDDRPEEIREKELAFRHYEHTAEYVQKKRLADAWCAAFVIRKQFLELGRDSSAYGITQEHLNELATGGITDSSIIAEVERSAERYQFFHWHLAFPEVFSEDGFDCVLGNPPWEAEELVEKEFFAVAAPHIASVRTKAKRSALIANLESTTPELFRAWKEAIREFDGRINFIRNSGGFPLGNSGKLNTYRLFAELAARLIAPKGRSGQILKSGIVSAQDGQRLFSNWIRDGRVVEVREFINTKLIFPAVVANERFCWLVLTGKGKKNNVATYAFTLESVEEVHDSLRSFLAPAVELALVNPIDKSVPPVSSQRDYLLVLRVHKFAQPLRLEDQSFNPLRIHYAQGHLNSASDSGLFADNTLEQLEATGAILDDKEWFHRADQSFMPLYEGKYIAQLNHRFSSFAGVPVRHRFGVKAEATNSGTSNLENPRFEIRPRYWLAESHAAQRFSIKDTRYEWLFGFRDVCRAIVDARTVQACILPKLPCLDGVPLLVFEGQGQEAAKTALLLNALWSSFAFDYVARQKIHGAHLTKAIAYQLPIPSDVAFDGEEIGQSYRDFVSQRSLELTVVSDSLIPFAHDLAYVGPPFRWDEERRFLLRCELDAAFFHLYLPSNRNGKWRAADGETAEDLEMVCASFAAPRDAVVFIMDTFPIVRRKDEAKFNGDYRTKRVILEMYDEMAQAMATGQPYQTRLNPPPADPACCHPKKKLGILAFGSLIDEPGAEIREKIIMRIKTSTPFGVEFGRYSGKSRGGAPTLVPHEAGSPVSAEILVFDDSVSVDEAKDMLWNRERRRIGSGEKYTEGTSQNSVLVREFTDSPSVASVLYTDFNLEGKIAAPTAAEVAQHAIESVSKAELGMDGITYLMNAMAAGIKTPLTQAYHDEILRQSETNSLLEALEKQKTQKVTSS
jgi:hypothetical protein